jgi:hypothetical protein
MTSRSPQTSMFSSANWSIAELPGLSTDTIALLTSNGVQTTFDLLKLGNTQEKRILFAKELHIHVQHVNKWCALANLARIPSVGCQYCGLLLHAGIASPAQLITTPIARLHRHILRLHVAMMQRKDLCPTVDQIDRWVQQARLLPPA